MFPNQVEKLSYDNGYELSVINGSGTYSGPGTFEVAIITPEGNVLEPEGYVTKERLQEIKDEVKNKGVK